MQLREHIANDHQTMSRTSLQRIYILIHFRNVYARLHGRKTTAAANIAAAFARVRIARGREQVSKSFIDAALTVPGRLLALPRVERMLLDMDSRPEESRPFNSVRCLQAVVTKCGSSTENVF